MNPLQRKLLVFGAWSGIAFILLFLGGWVFLAKFIPPHRPSDSAEAIAEIVRGNIFGIRLAMILQMMGAAAYIFYSGALIKLVSEIEEGPGVLTYITALASVGNACLIFYPATWWMTATFRPERDAQLIYLLNDAAWLQFVGGLFLAWPFFISLALAAFAESGTDRYLSRWYGYLCAWVAVLFLPGQLLFFLKTGPFAWNGLISLYVPLTAFVTWQVATVYFLIRASKRP